MWLGKNVFRLLPFFRNHYIITSQSYGFESKYQHLTNVTWKAKKSRFTLANQGTKVLK